MVLSILLYGIPAWHPDVTRIKELNKFQKSSIRWIFGFEPQYEQQMKSQNILPVCYQIELLMFTMISKLFSGRYRYDFATHTDFRVHDRSLCTQTMSLRTCRYYSLAHQKSMFSRTAEKVNFLIDMKSLLGWIL